MVTTTFFACNLDRNDAASTNNDNPEQTITNSTANLSSDDISEQTTQGNEVNPSILEETSQEPSPIYPPDSIILYDDLIQDDFAFSPTMRRIFYGVPGPLTFLFPEGIFDELFEKDKDIYRENIEMVLVTLVKYCNTPREEFDRAIAELVEMYTNNGLDMTEEDFEIPNADIIYTFDNEIINAYYRRENPVAPDWLTNLQRQP